MPSPRRRRCDDIALLALHLGLDRQAEGGGACARRPAADQRSLCGADPRHHRERRLLLGGEAVLRLWARQRDDVSAVGRRDHGAAAGPADARRCRGAAAPASGHCVLRGADLLCRVPGEFQGAGARRTEAALLRVRRRGAAAGYRPALARALRRRHPRRARLDRDAAHLPLQPSGRREIRHLRQAGAGLRHPPRRRRRHGDRPSRARWANCRCAGRPAR